jgi:hypothetical protein
MPAPLPADSLWRDKTYRRLWLSLLLSAFAAHITGLTLALTAAVQLRATATQIATLGAVGALPHALFLLPAGVWLDRMRKLPAYLTGELVMVVALAAVPLAWACDRLEIGILYAISFVGGLVSAVSGTAGQIVLTQVVGREQLVEAHGKSRVAASFAEVAGPGVAGILIKLVGAPFALLANCALLLGSVTILRRLEVTEPPPAARHPRFWPQLKEGIRFVAGDRLLLPMALAVGCWQVLQTCAMVTQVLFATRELHLSELELGLCLTGAGLGTVVAGLLGHHPGWTLRPRADADRRHRHQRRRLAAAQRGAIRNVRRRVLHSHAALLQYRRGPDLQQHAGAAAGAHPGTNAGAHDRHHALADAFSGVARHAARRCAGGEFRPSRSAGRRRRRRAGAGSLALAILDSAPDDHLGSRRGCRHQALTSPFGTIRTDASAIRPDSFPPSR